MQRGTPASALALTVGVGFTQSWHTAALAAAVVLGVRFFEDYFVMPRVLGGAVGLSPLIVLVSVFATGILLGGFYILLAIPFSAAIATIVDVVAFGVDPAEVETPTVLFRAEETESS
jgi:predicted PurR-regulated permease PerM